jgi:hypothetical protein
VLIIKQDPLLAGFIRGFWISTRDKAAPRITENTLIRVAVEALLNNEGSLAGDDEESLLASLLQDP